MTRASSLAEVNQWIERYGASQVPVGALLCDNHVAEGRPALIFEGGDGRSETISYADLRDASSRLAGSLLEQGICRGDRVSVLMGKSPELLITLVALWRIGAVHVPLFTAFGPDAIAYRVEHSGSRALFVDQANSEKAKAVAGRVEHTILSSASVAKRVMHDREMHDFSSLIENGASTEPEIMDGNDLLILLYTSGTTGQPKGVEVPVRGLAFIHAYMHFSLDVRPEDRFWNIADPGWGYGLWFAVIGPLLLGQTTLLRGVSFDATDVLDALVRHQITNMTSAPTAYRAIRVEGVPESFKDASRLRAISSAGEPLNPELFEWSERELGMPIHDHYGQSEAGMVLGHHHHPALRSKPQPGSMGTPLPGFRAVVLDEAGNEVDVDVPGELAIDTTQSPLFCFQRYYRDPQRTAERFRFGSQYYLTADTSRIGSDGLFRFASRADDVILSAGYRIGPFEIENVLIGHPSVAEVAVVGVPDELRGEMVVAFVVLGRGEPSEALADELKQLVKKRLAAHMYPREVHFVDGLPRTPSGKIQRRLLRDSARHEASS